MRRAAAGIVLAVAMAGCTAGSDRADDSRTPPPATNEGAFELGWQPRLGQGSSLVADFDADGVDGVDDTLFMYNAGLWSNIEDWFLELDLGTGDRQTLGLSTFQTGVSFDDPPRLMLVADVPGRPAKGAWADVGDSAIQSQVALLLVDDGRLRGATIDGRPGMFGRSFSLGGIVGKATSSIECLDGAATVQTHWTASSAQGPIRGTTTYQLDGTTFYEIARQSTSFDLRSESTTPARTLDCPPA